MKTRKLEILFLTGFSSTKMFVNSKNLRQWKSGFHSSEKVDSLHIKLCISPWRNKIKELTFAMEFLNFAVFAWHINSHVNWQYVWCHYSGLITIWKFPFFLSLTSPEKPIITEPIIIWRIFHRNLMEMQSSSFLY